MLCVWVMKRICSTAAVSCNGTGQAKYTHQSIHQPSFNPSSSFHHTIKQWGGGGGGGGGERDAAIGREHLASAENAGRRKERQERESCIVPTKSYRERKRAGRKVCFSPIATLSLCHIDKVSVQLHLLLSVSLSLTHTHTHTLTQWWCCRDMLWNPAASSGQTHGISSALISSVSSDNHNNLDRGGRQHRYGHWHAHAHTHTHTHTHTHVLVRQHISQIYAVCNCFRQHRRAFSSLSKTSRWGPQSARAGQRPWGWSIMQRNSLSPFRSALPSSLSRRRWVCENVGCRTSVAWLKSAVQV